MQNKNRNGNRHGGRVERSEKSLAESVREFHDTTRALVQLAFYLLLSSLSFGVVLVGAYRFRVWLG